MEAMELVIATLLTLGVIVVVMFKGDPSLLDAMIHYLMNANIVTVI